MKRKHLWIVALIMCVAISFVINLLSVRVLIATVIISFVISAVWIIAQEMNKKHKAYLRYSERQPKVEKK